MLYGCLHVVIFIVITNTGEVLELLRFLNELFLALKSPVYASAGNVKTSSIPVTLSIYLQAQLLDHLRMHSLCTRTLYCKEKSKKNYYRICKWLQD